MGPNCLQFFKSSAYEKSRLKQASIIPLCDNPENEQPVSKEFSQESSEGKLFFCES